MLRTFHHRFTLGGKCGIALCAGLALYLFWVKAVLLALLASLGLVLIVERTLHSEYVIDEDSLIIRRGRFSREVVIPLDDILTCEKMKSNFGLTTFLLVTTADNKLYMVQPDNESAFLRALKMK